MRLTRIKHRTSPAVWRGGSCRGVRSQADKPAAADTTAKGAVASAAACAGDNGGSRSPPASARPSSPTRSATCDISSSLRTATCTRTRGAGSTIPKAAPVAALSRRAARHEPRWPRRCDPALRRLARQRRRGRHRDRALQRRALRRVEGQDRPLRDGLGLVHAQGRARDDRERAAAHRRSPNASVRDRQRRASCSSTSARRPTRARSRTARSSRPGTSPCTELETRGGIWRYDANKTGQRSRPPSATRPESATP